MTTLTATTVSPREARTPAPTVEIAGVDWPLYKVQAIVIGILVATLVGAVTQSGELTAWTLTIVTAVAWCVRRAACARPTRA
ncbi:hypothetical protein [Williamsia phyllosphaerae]|uniref:Uncharacterized protein n=1 Tax=Williamsia phyllosphaerae TaxID=885042 RepID=A0ABQ1UYX7_9NOCA|nr:hypothetical protein [Williamsia phyllosphaerae]GGF29748.1 hypothetical protein GCM10007298_27120 [Williamsia phyllosphaerae]